MFWYVLNILILTFAWLFPAYRPVRAYVSPDEKKIEEKHKRKRICVIGTLNWIILSGFRALSVGADTEAYGKAFLKVIDTSWETIFENIYLKYFKGLEIKDPGFPLVEKIFQIFSTDYQLFLVFIAALFCVPMGIFIFKYSRNPYVSFILYSCLFYSFFAVTGHRQTIATAFVVFMAIELIKNRKLFWFICVVLLASTIHKSALCVLPFYWITKIKINKPVIWIYWICIGLSFIFRYQLLSFLQQLVGYESYQDYEGAGATTFTILLLAISIIVSVFHKLILREDKVMVRYSMHAIYCASFFSSLLMINPSFMRVVQYFSIFLLVLLPEIEVIFKTKNDKIIYHTVCCFMLIILLLLNQPHYAFCWA